MHTYHWSWLVWSIIGVCIPHAARAADGEPNWNRVLEGEVIVETVQPRGGIPGVQAMFAVAAPRERIWKTLLDYDNFTKIFKGIEKMRVLENTPAGAQIEFWIDAAFKKYHYVLSRHYDDPGRRLTWTRLSGDLKRIEGSWEIRDTPHPGVYLLIYESYVEMTDGPPGMMLRLAALARTRNMAERLRNWIEGRPLPE
jgi:uncharacterized membrane protein